MELPIVVAGQRLPALELCGLFNADPVRVVCNGRFSIALVPIHANCSACNDYVTELVRQGAEFAAWDCRLLVAVTGDVPTGSAINDCRAALTS